MSDPVIVGAVLYDPKVSVIWDIIRDFFDGQGCPIDVVYYGNYELQVTALLGGHLDVAWNSPLAWLDAQRRSGERCRAIAMRDTDRDRVSHMVARADGGIGGPADLRGKTVAVGAKDSPQATLIPLGLLKRLGL
jgi:ABC-type phosphate/phosphonate transport system substrate-binding protein